MATIPFVLGAWEFGKRIVRPALSGRCTVLCSSCHTLRQRTNAWFRLCLSVVTSSLISDLLLSAQHSQLTLTAYIFAGASLQIIQRRCKVCEGSGLVMKGKYPKKCPECGGFFPWVSWKMFLFSTATPGNGGEFSPP